MANPLARVVMNNIAQKSGMVNTRSQRTQASQSSHSAQNTGLNNLDRRETQILSDLINNKKSVTMGSSSSYDKSTYGRSSNVSNASKNTMKTLNSLVSGSKEKSEAPRTQYNDRNKECPVDKSKPGLKSLCSLDNISVGKSNSNSESKTINTNKKSTIKALDLSDLVKGTAKTEKREVNTSKRQSGGMTTLGDLANEKTKNTQRQETKTNSKTDDKAITTNNSFVKSKTVINNLEAYVPKVTLESIGKKGSLF